MRHEKVKKVPLYWKYFSFFLQKLFFLFNEILTPEIVQRFISLKVMLEFHPPFWGLIQYLWDRTMNTQGTLYPGDQKALWYLYAYKLYQSFLKKTKTIKKIKLEKFLLLVSFLKGFLVSWLLWKEKSSRDLFKVVHSNADKIYT